MKLRCRYIATYVLDLHISLIPTFGSFQHADNENI